MKILVVCQYYYPEPFRISDLCEEMVQRGHEVTVITGVPNYPEGITYDEYKNGKKRQEVINGVKIHRCFTIGRRTGIVYRFLNYYSYAFSSSFKVFRNRLKLKLNDEKDYDVILVNQLSPVMMAYAGIIYKKLHKKKLVLYCLDLWPESLVAGGINRKSIIYKIFHHISKRIYKNCDRILVTSGMFEEYIHSQFKINKNIIDYLPQYAESLFDSISSENKKKTTIDLVFAGNIGEIQSVETIIEAANILKDVSNLQFHIVGGGTDLERCKEIARDKMLSNVIFYGRLPVSEMPRYYEIADAMIITLKADPIISLTLPGKVQSYMAAGKPIIGAINGEAQEVIKNANCGFTGSADDAKKLAINIQKFIGLDENERTTMGNRARKYYENNFSRDKHMEMIEKVLKENVS